MTRNEPRTLRAVERNLDVVEALREEDSMGVTELSNRLDLPTSTVHVHLQTLRERGYVVKDENRYKLSLQFLQHGGGIREDLAVYRHGREVVRDLSQQTGELVNLAVEEDGRGVVIFMALGEDAAVDLAPVGKYTRLHQPAFGKAILAELPNDEVDAIVDRWGLQTVTPHTVSSKEGLFDQLAEVRERGYAVERDEGDVGISCIGASISDANGRPLGAMSTSVPTNKLRNEEVEEELAQQILNGTNVVELKIEHS